MSTALKVRPETQATSPEPRRVEVCGLQVIAHEPAEAFPLFRPRSPQARSRWIVTLNLEMIARAAREPEYRELLAAADERCADGMPILWALNAKVRKQPVRERMTGVELTREILLNPVFRKIAIIGGADADRALRALGLDPRDSRYVILTGTFSPDPFHSAARLTELVGAGCDAVLVALGVPKQDRYCAFLRDRLPGAVILGIGGSLELASGLKLRAPRFLQRLGLEWAFRLASEPGRLWRRYLLEYPGGVKSLIADLRR